MTFNDESSRRKNRLLGYTLTELMIVVAIVAILTAFAYPSFLQSVRKSKRTDAHTALVRTAGNLERFFGTNGTYTVDTAVLGLKINAGTAYSDDGHYVVTVTAGATGIGSSYVISTNATAGDIQAADAGCTTLTMDSLGRRTPDPATSRCW